MYSVSFNCLFVIVCLTQSKSLALLQTVSKREKQ
jgi:hypothetical protein